jgi:hypothetical protein
MYRDYYAAVDITSGNTFIPVIFHMTIKREKHVLFPQFLSMITSVKSWELNMYFYEQFSFHMTKREETYSFPPFLSKMMTAWC